jgi:uncharacterized repeat protein (TIGR03837 family)
MTAAGNGNLPPITCDIFCTVVDNYGDIGVCWRLARQLVREYGVSVQLWVDDLASLKRLSPEVDARLVQQQCCGVEICLWTPLFPEVEPAQLVIESFACELPERYVLAMAGQKQPPVWINLEYLSAEDWVEECHKLPSPHPRLPLVKYFFFPGFTPQTGGLLLERDLLERREAFQNSPKTVNEYWQSLNIPAPQADELRISLFCYENPVLPDLLRAWEQGTQRITCLVPEGRALPQVAAFFGAQQGKAGDAWQRGKLSVHALPFVEQERYDELLWACDINFVRGEDSFVRAQWAGRPFVWHIYPQHDGVHMQKLRAFMARHCENLSPDAAQALHRLWESWNGGEGIAAAWNEFATHRSMLRQHSREWSQQLSGNNLALNLLDFFGEIGKMRDFEI